MRLEDMLKDITGITNQVIKTNCFDDQNTLLDSILLLQTKMNEVIQAINDGIIKGDKGDTPIVQVGNTETLEPGENASVTQTGDILNPILNFAIPKGEKGDKGDTGKASESIQDDVVSLDTCYSSEKTVSLFNDLKNVQGVKYGNDVGYQVCKGTHNGIVKDLKVYGKSLVNVGGSNFTWGKNYANLIIKKELIKPNTKYGFKLEGDLSNLSKIYCGSSDDLEILIPVKYNTTQMIFTSPNINFTKEIKFICYNNGTEFTEAQVKTWKLTLVECDSLDEMPQYFEGIASVGNGNEIEVSSGSKNIAYEVVMGSVGSSGEMIESSSSNRLNMTRVIPNTRYIFSKDSVPRNCNKFFYDIEGNCIGQDFSSGTNSVFTTSNNCYYVVLTWGSSQEVGKYQLEIGDTVTSYVEPKQDKKTILFKDTDNTWKPVTNLRGIDGNNCDIVDSVGNKFIKKYEKVVISSSNGFKVVTPSSNVKTVQFWNDGHTNLPKIIKGGKKCVCDKLRIESTTTKDEEFFLNGANAFVISLDKAKASTLEQLNTYLSNNPMEFTYEISVEEYEINPLFPTSYENETMISFNTGAIPCKNEFYIDSNLGSLQLETLDRLSRIEDYVYQSNVAILRGDFRTLAEIYYPNDFIKEEELPNE